MKKAQIKNYISIRNNGKGSVVGIIQHRHPNDAKAKIKGYKLRNGIYIGNWY
jgi:hypothetical protein